MNAADFHYLSPDPFNYPYGDGDTDVRLRKVRIIVTRKPQTCVPPPGIGKDVHEIPPGTKARFESAIVEGVWSKCYTCLNCMDIWMSPPFECGRAGR